MTCYVQFAVNDEQFELFNELLRDNGIGDNMSLSKQIKTYLIKQAEFNHASVLDKDGHSSLLGDSTIN